MSKTLTILVASLICVNVMAETDPIAGKRLKEIAKGTQVAKYRLEDLYVADDATIGDDLSVVDDASVGGDLTVTGAINGSGPIQSAATASSNDLYGTPVTIMFDPTTAGGTTTNSYTVPTGYDLVVLDAYGWKTDAAAAAGDTWDIKNNDGTAANIFAQLDIGTATLADGARGSFIGYVDAENEVESGDTLEFIAVETADDDGAEGLIVITGLLKTAD